jgi:hypothetical protein
VRFEDLYFFFFQLLLVWDLLCGLFFWLCVTATHASGAGRTVSYTQLSVGLLWLEHVGLALSFVCIGLLGLGLRVWAYLPPEFSGFWL